MTVFQHFSTTAYTFLEIFQSRVRGDMVKSERELFGIFKDKAGKTQSGNAEAITSDATLYVKPEDFPEKHSAADFIGQGVRVNDQEYSIIGATGGMNFETGILEHYRLTLQKAEFIKEAPNV